MSELLKTRGREGEERSLGRPWALGGPKSDPASVTAAARHSRPDAGPCPAPSAPLRPRIFPPTRLPRLPGLPGLRPPARPQQPGPMHDSARRTKRAGPAKRGVQAGSG